MELIYLPAQNKKVRSTELTNMQTTVTLQINNFVTGRHYSLGIMELLFV